jgi:hypothetical protein
MWVGVTSPSAGKFSGVVGVTTGVYAPQRVYILEPSVTSVYDPVNDVWSTAKTMLIPRYAFGVAVVDDVLYAIGGSTPNTGVEFLSVNEQYIPIGYNATLPPVASSSTTIIPESSKPITSTTNHEPSDNPFEHTLTYIIAAVLVLTVGTVTVCLLFSFKKSKDRVHQTKYWKNEVF